MAKTNVEMKRVTTSTRRFSAVFPLLVLGMLNLQTAFTKVEMKRATTINHQQRSVQVVDVEKEER